MAQPEKNMAEITESGLVIAHGTPVEAAALAKRSDIINGLPKYQGTEPSQPPERIVSPETGRQPSVFERTLFTIAELQNLPDSPEKTSRLQQEITKLNEMIAVANEAGLFQAEKPGLYDLLRMGRIDMSIRDRREGTKLRHIADVAIRAEQVTVESEAFWNDPRYPQRRQLRAELGGSVDYFNRGSTALIYSVVKNPRGENGSADILAVRDYVDIRAEYVGLSGIMDAWNYRWGKGVEEFSENFEDLRIKLEQERQKKPKFMKHAYYHTVEFFVDNMQELGVATKDFVKHAIADLPRGESKVMLQNLQQEQAAAQSAFADAILFFERKAEEPEVKWIASAMNSEFSMAGIGFFQRLGGKGVEGFQYFTNSWAEGLRKTDTSVNYEDALTLDEDGMFLYIAERLCQNNGEIFRFGSDSPKFPTEAEIYAYLGREREKIIEDAARHRLRSIGDSSATNYLLKGNEIYDPANPNPLTLSDPKNPLHKLFGQLKVKFDEIDKEDIKRGGIITKSRWDIYKEENRNAIPRHRAFAQVKAKCDLLDAEDVLNGINNTERRWDIYKREAKAWEDFARNGQEDSRDLQAKVKFVHPLARNFRNNKEFFDMYEETTATEARRERAKYLIKRVEDYLRFNMVEVRSGSARIHIFKKGEKKPIRVEAYTNILKKELRRVMALDEKKDPLDKRFKLTYILKKMGYEPDMPAYGMFALGADDTIRNEATEKHFREEPEFDALFEEIEKNETESQQEEDNRRKELERQGKTDDEIKADPILKLKEFVKDRIFRGSNPKTIIVKFAEDERLAVQAVQRAIRLSDRIDIVGNDGKPTGEYYSGKKYDNFPGYDIPGEEGGTKFYKNHLYPDYGTSRGTVRVNGMIPFMNFGVLDRISELGGWTPKYIVGLRHRSDEIEFANEGSLMIDPKDTQDYLTRFESMIKKRGLWTGVGDAEKKPGAMMGGLFAGMYKLRELGTRVEFFNTEFIREISGSRLPETIEKPQAALSPKYLKESGKSAYLDTIASVVGPLEALMRANLELETAYGYAQGTAKNMNTMLMQDTGYWMDHEWREYRGDYGYAIDGMLHMSRNLMYTYLKEAGLIWPEDRMENIEGWNDIAKRLVKDLPEDLRIGVPVGVFEYPDKNSIPKEKLDAASRYLKAPTVDKEETRAKILKNL